MRKEKENYNRYDNFWISTYSCFFMQAHSNFRELFAMFLDFPKPIVVAVNGPAIGAAVTSATLCDAIFCSTTATFVTPFAALGLPPEGTSSHGHTYRTNHICVHMHSYA
jgi:enoyl-CoA hydratase/carnithine racemase